MMIQCFTGLVRFGGWLGGWLGEWVESHILSLSLSLFVTGRSVGSVRFILAGRGGEVVDFVGDLNLISILP